MVKGKGHTSRNSTLSFIAYTRLAAALGFRTRVPDATNTMRQGLPYGPPQMPLGLHLEPMAQGVAFRAHQALPVGRAQQCRYGPQPASKYWFKEFKALTNTAGD